MPEALAAALEHPALWPLLGVSTLAGLIYGFAGFGSALIFMPLATVWLPPEDAVAAFSVSALASVATVLPRAWKKADRMETATILGAAVLAVPFGVYLLRSLDDALVRWCVSGVVAVTLLALIFGIRFRTRPTRSARIGVGAASGLVGGATGLSGPIVVLFHLGGADGAARTRANTLVFLTLFSLLLLPQLALQGALSAAAVWLGLILLVPYGLGSRAGQALFTPGRENLYRATAFGVIGGAVILGLPIWGAG